MVSMAEVLKCIAMDNAEGWLNWTGRIDLRENNLKDNIMVINAYICQLPNFGGKRRLYGEKQSLRRNHPICIEERTYKLAIWQKQDPIYDNSMLIQKNSSNKSLKTEMSKEIVLSSQIQYKVTIHAENKQCSLLECSRGGMMVILRWQRDICWLWTWIANQWSNSVFQIYIQTIWHITRMKTSLLSRLLWVIRLFHYRVGSTERDCYWYG